GQIVATTDPQSPELPRRYFRAQVEVLDRAWQIALVRDAVHEAAVGTERVHGLRAHLQRRLSTPFYQALLHATREDPYTEQRFFEAVNVLAPLDKMLAEPRVLAAIARISMRRALGLGRLPPNVSPEREPPAAIWGEPSGAARIAPLAEGQP